MQAVKNSSLTNPLWITALQCSLFAALFGVWVLPETILVRHVCLILGAILSLPVVYSNRHLFFSIKAIPIWLVIGLVIWAGFHLLFLSQDYAMQLIEYQSIWKRTAIGFIFALGLGISLASQMYSKKSKLYWWIIYFGFCLPLVIYYIKLVAMYLMTNQDFDIPNYLQLYSESAKFYVHKSAYVYFCLPALAMALGRIVQVVRNKEPFQLQMWVYLLVIFGVVFNFIQQGDRNGLLYVSLLIVYAVMSMIMKLTKIATLKNFIILVIILGVLSTVAIHQSRNPDWQSFAMDLKFSIDTRENFWKGAGEIPKYPNGISLSGTNYARMAWGMAAIPLIAENPLGYGLIEESFGHLAKIKWPESILTQSHSGWLDLTLGIGIPGVLLILLASALAWVDSCKVPPPWNLIGSWALSSILLAFCTTELSQRVYFDGLIFLIILASGFNLGSKVDGVNSSPS